MLYPSIDDLKKKADSRYTLVMIASKRARDLIDGYPALVNIDNEKPVSIATEEIAEDLVSYTRRFPVNDLTEDGEGMETDDVFTTDVSGEGIAIPDENGQPEEGDVYSSGEWTEGIRLDEEDTEAAVKPENNSDDPDSLSQEPEEITEYE